MLNFARTRTTVPAAKISGQHSRIPHRSAEIRSILRGPRIQSKLSIGAVDSPAEREADAVADEVMRMPAPEARRDLPPITARGGGAEVRRICAECDDKLNRKPEDGELRREAGEPDEYMLRARTAPGTVPELSQRAETAVRGLGGGTPLAATERAYFEPRFGRDLSNVRVHTGAPAHQAASAIRARAFALGRDIAFAEGEYRPGSTEGRRLIAHELTHVAQQDPGGPVIRRSCGEDFGPGEDGDCAGTIDVRAGEITLPNISYFHLYVVYTDAAGNAWGLRGAPGGAEEGYGPVVTECGAYQEGFIDYDPRSPSVRVYEGDDACSKAQTMAAHLNDIESWSIPYVVNGPNSNSVVASMLVAAGLPTRKPNVAAPGFDTRLTPEGPDDAPGMGDRRHFLLLTVNSFDQFSTFGFGYSIDALETHGISFPLMIGAEYSLSSRSIIGRLGGGIDVPLVNIPTTPLLPTHIRLSGGFQAGRQPGRFDMDAVIGGFFEAEAGADIGRFRLSPFYRFSHLRNLSTGQSTNAHLGGLNLGVAF
ncbi:MAG: DUF4157 domain-containing protein [Pseudomonadota bacterium]